jgi:hypothetical protein
VRAPSMFTLRGHCLCGTQESAIRHPHIAFKGLQVMCQVQGWIEGFARLHCLLAVEHMWHSSIGHTVCSLLMCGPLHPANA